MKGIQNIIFDLGGVLLDIDTGKTNEAFARLGVPGFDNNYTLQKADPLFDNFERGRVPEPDFFTGIRKIAGIALSDTDIRNAWNALILDFRAESIRHLKSLKQRYNLYLLSNTNSIHYTAFQQLFTDQIGQPGFDEHFIKAYYSHQLGFRKPDQDIYRHVLEDAGMRAAESLFIDDLAKNTEAAAALGIKTHQLLPGERIEEIGL